MSGIIISVGLLYTVTGYEKNLFGNRPTDDNSIK